MRLNASPLNRVSLNGGHPRLPALGDASALVLVNAQLDGQARRVGTGTTQISLLSDFLGSAERFGLGAAPIVIDTGLQYNVSRNGQGDAVFALYGDLFYAKNVTGFGTAVLEIDALGYVGVIFGEGDIVLTPATPELDGARGRPGSGVAEMAVVGELDPSAIRRTQLVADTILLKGCLDASHIDDEGVRYIGGSGTATTTLSAEDAGMLRQAVLGDANFDFQGQGSAIKVKPTLSGQTPVTLTMQADTTAIRRGDGAATVTLAGQLDGEIYVRGEGTLTLAVVATGTGYVFRRTATGTAVTTLIVEPEMLIAKVGEGEMSLPVTAEMTGVRTRFWDADAVMTLFSASDAYLNPAAMDIEEQWFSRPDEPRSFSRPEMQRDFLRTP